MSDYMPKCATCEHFESCIIQKHLTEMALILWNISKAEDKADRKTEPQTEMEKSGSRAVLTARCLNCHNAKDCKENHWEVCRYEPWKLTAVEDEPQTDCSWKKGE